MKWLLLIAVIFASCQNNAGDKGAGLDLSGYTVEKIPGTSFQRARRIQGDKVIEEGMVLNGKKNGTWITYHGDEKNFPKTIATYADDALSGPYMEINEYGQFLLIAQYRNNKFDGRVAKYNFTRLAEEFHYKNGVLDGLYAVYYENSDIRQRSAEFKNGVEHGAVRFYDPQGNITVEYQYKNGEKISGGMVSPPGKGN
jgi:antitoxin component YwqK of YwqJK toxin-antitoxin module